MGVAFLKRVMELAFPEIHCYVLGFGGIVRSFCNTKGKVLVSIGWDWFETVQET